jgi:hypothetical protein
VPVDLERVSERILEASMTAPRTYVCHAEDCPALCQDNCPVVGTGNSRHQPGDVFAHRCTCDGKEWLEGLANAYDDEREERKMQYAARKDAEAALAAERDRIKAIVREVTQKTYDRDNGCSYDDDGCLGQLSEEIRDEILRRIGEIHERDQVALSRAQEALQTVQHLLNLYEGMDAVTVARRLGGVRDEIDAALAQPPSGEGEK